MIIHDLMICIPGFVCDEISKRAIYLIRSGKDEMPSSSQGKMVADRDEEKMKVPFIPDIIEVPENSVHVLVSIRFLELCVSSVR